MTSLLSCDRSIPTPSSTSPNINKGDDDLSSSSFVSFSSFLSMAYHPASQSDLSSTEWISNECCQQRSCQWMKWNLEKGIELIFPSRRRRRCRGTEMKQKTKQKKKRRGSSCQQKIIVVIDKAKKSVRWLRARFAAFSFSLSSLLSPSSLLLLVSLLNSKRTPLRVSRALTTVRQCAPGRIEEEFSCFPFLSSPSSSSRRSLI